MLTPISLGDNRFKDVNGVRVIGGSVPTGWVLKFGLVEVFHAGVSKSFYHVRALSSNNQGEILQRRGKRRYKSAGSPSVT